MILMDHWSLISLWVTHYTMSSIVRRTRPAPALMRLNKYSDARIQGWREMRVRVWKALSSVWDQDWRLRLSLEGWPGAVEVFTMILIFTNCRASKTTSLVTIERRDRKQSEPPGRVWPGPSLGARPAQSRSRLWAHNIYNITIPGPTFQLSHRIKIGTTLYGGPDSYSPDIKRVNQIF